ncbi:PAS domain S-box-containing protein [Desulfobacula phenolica]|uniref:histidine kinase n=2 Tax=Desulfobacula phenolica TaxID=90732 RepID=A0A1H2JRZ3_9BACT|nr:PAS domain S-box-containing protein [Desulfobacula phenolica]
MVAKMSIKKFDWEDFFNRHRAEITLEWKKRLKYHVSRNYELRSLDELRVTTEMAYDASCSMIVCNDHALINRFIDEISNIRLEEGFRLDDVQKAFELFRKLIVPALIKESPRELLCENIEAVNTALSYTINRFSSDFQKKHEKYLKDYAQQLEKDVASRTVELKESEHKYKTLVEEISDGFLVLDKDRIAFVNPAFCGMHGCRIKEPLQASFLSFVSKKSHEKVSAIISRGINKGAEPEAFEYLRLTKDKKCLPTEINFRPSRFGGRDYNLCIVRDITKRVETEKKSREMERMAYIGQLTASLSHEIRNPLSSVKMNLQILGKNIILKGNDRKRIQISEREINRLEGILKQLLDFAKPVSLKFDMVDINDIVRSCVELLEMKFHRKSIECEIKLDPGLKEFSADKDKVEQIIINFLLNALDSVDDFGIIRVLTAVKKQNGTPCAMIRVEDNGKGISRDLLPHIFEPFYTTKTNGTGLGLANVKQIATAHGGRVRVIDLKNSGTAFEVFLPMGEING